MSKKLLLETNKTEPVLLEKKEKKLRKLIGKRYYFKPINFLLYSNNEDDKHYLEVRNYNQKTALIETLASKKVGTVLYCGESRNNNVYLEIDTTVTIRVFEIKDHTSKTLTLEIAEALDKAKVVMFTALYENNDDEENKIQFDEYLETAINFSKNREKELLDEFTEGIIFDGDSYKEWYELYCEQIEKIYVEEFMWLVQKSEDDKENNPDPVPYSIDSPYPADKYPHKYYRNYKNNPNPFVSAFYKLKKVYQFTKTHGRPSLYEIFNSED